MRSYRGQRGSGRATWRSSLDSNTSQGPIKTLPAPPLGTLLECLVPEQLDEEDKGEHGKAEITDCQFLASYNWADSADPTIIFPGMPAMWSPPPGSTELPQDSGECFRDQNAARKPEHTMEPAVKAVLNLNPDFDTAAVDIFACTSTLGNLQRFLKKDDKTFRFTVEAIGRTVFFLRRENAPDEKIPGPKGFGPVGYGHTFPERYTKWQEGTEGSASAQRIVSYDFAGLKCLVRFEIDGYLEHEVEKEEGEDADASGDGGSEPRPSMPEIDNTKVRRGGRLIPQNAVFELKTRSIFKQGQDQLTEYMPRMWQAQIPYFILAFHHKGTFSPENITVEDIRPKAAEWQESNQNTLHQLGRLLRRLAALARDSALGKYEVVLQQAGVLQIRRQGGTVSSPLPDPSVWTKAGQRRSSFSSESSGVSVGAEQSELDAAVYSDGDEDFTACSDSCGYCGRCSYKKR